ncbi:DUF4136 domain-containing protein [Sphingobium nicotianae]|uniref:DUF4136 domain-containing protein n=1 Tax=Sphingobium nicotianae TaxID=2782607 RepID=A0A9X1IQ16_9SPHN|nr:DUF4136 domain-containing protein [Sphingobium nicotianae]MBT2186463.1 hypothetical protein [Sphingobium nicotianae]
MSAIRFSSSLLLIGALSAAMPATAQPGWGRGGFGPYGGLGRGDWGGSRLSRAASSAADPREGKVDAAQFTADDAGNALGHGPVAVTIAQGSTTGAGDQPTYEAAVIDQLVKAGYDTIKPDPNGGQIAEIKIVRDVLVPQEQKRKPVSGEVTVGASNYGTFTGMAVAVDLSKPRKALVSTRLEARLLDRATGKPLWEGRAEIATREGDSHWSEQAIATRLAAALFDRFPSGPGEKVASR